jgi:hypothetical protein
MRLIRQPRRLLGMTKLVSSIQRRIPCATCRLRAIMTTNASRKTYLLKPSERSCPIHLMHAGSGSGRPDRAGGLYPLRVGVTMSLHKLTAGSGYDYLTRQVAAFDATEKGHAGLASY